MATNSNWISKIPETKDQRVALAYTTDYACPHCLEESRFESKPILKEIEERVFQCPVCKTEYPFNDLSQSYDYLQQKLFATMWQQQKLLNVSNKKLVELMEKETKLNDVVSPTAYISDKEKAILTEAQSTEDEVAIEQQTMNSAIKAQQYVSSLLTLSYFLYKAEEPEMPEE